MPTWLEQFGHFVGGSAAPLVQRSVSGQQMCTSRFSQCLAPVLPTISLVPTTAGGICEALSAYWILFHAKGMSLWNWLTPNNRLDLGHLWPIMELQTQGIVAPDQDTVTFAWLAARGIIRTKPSSGRRRPALRRILADDNGPRHATGTTGVFSCANLAREIARDFSSVQGQRRSQGANRTIGVSGGQYKKIAIRGTAGAHAMAAWVAEDVLFFDPNFGEYWFPNAASFITWFSGSFWYRSLYAAGLSGTYAVDSVALRL